MNKIRTLKAIGKQYIDNAPTLYDIDVTDFAKSMYTGSPGFFIDLINQDPNQKEALKRISLQNSSFLKRHFFKSVFSAFIFGNICMLVGLKYIHKFMHHT